MSKSMPKMYYQYLFEQQIVDFVLLELTLYLDTHPDDTQVFAQFAQFQKRKQNLMQQFEAKFGPLREFGNSPSLDSWTWSQGPWPWQV